jgi:hypothetical protein
MYVQTDASGRRLKFKSAKAARQHKRMIEQTTYVAKTQICPDDAIRQQVFDRNALRWIDGQLVQGQGHDANYVGSAHKVKVIAKAKASDKTSGRVTYVGPRSIKTEGLDLSANADTAGISFARHAMKLATKRSKSEDQRLSWEGKLVRDAQAFIIARKL